MGTFRSYPPPPPGVRVVEFVTAYPSDPVMERRWGHEVAPPEVGPPGAERIVLDPKMDHNFAVSIVIDRLLSELKHAAHSYTHARPSGEPGARDPDHG
jgi:hypothetical protein